MKRLPFVVLLLLVVAWPNFSQAGHSITLSWAPSVVCSATVTTNCGGAPTSYNVKRGTSSGTETVLAHVTPPATGSPVYVDTSGTAGVTYFYVVSAVNQFGESANSTEVSATFLGDLPAAPSGLAAVSK